MARSTMQPNARRVCARPRARLTRHSLASGLWEHSSVPFEMQPVPGVPGAVLSELSVWSGLTFSVNGKRVKARGVWDRRVTLPGTDGPVEGRLKNGLPGAQRLIVAGNAYPIGPPVPGGLQILAVLPVLL